MRLFVALCLSSLLFASLIVIIDGGFINKPPKPTLPANADRTAIIHQILRAQVEQLANSTSTLVSYGTGNNVAQSVGGVVRLLGTKLVDMIVKVHELEDRKRNLTLSIG